jgi:hypothetical protein
MGSPSDVMNSPSLTERKKAFLHYQGGYSKSRLIPLPAPVNVENRG